MNGDKEAKVRGRKPEDDVECTAESWGCNETRTEWDDSYLYV